VKKGGKSLRRNRRSKEVSVPARWGEPEWKTEAASVNKVEDGSKKDNARSCGDSRRKKRERLVDHRNEPGQGSHKSPPESLMEEKEGLWEASVKRGELARGKIGTESRDPGGVTRLGGNIKAQVLAPWLRRRSSPGPLGLNKGRRK